MSRAMAYLQTPVEGNRVIHINSKIKRSGILAFLAVSMLAAGGIQAAPAAKKKKVETFSDMLQCWGVKNAAERKYIEDTVKQELQDEVTGYIDLKLDVEVYLKSLNHLVNGEVKEMNAYLVEEVAKKLLEWAVGGGPAKVLFAAWDFNKYVWKSVQGWAEKKDVEYYHKWLLKTVEGWRRGRTWGLDKREDTRRLFDLFWQDNQHKFGKTKIKGKMADDYRIKFEAACRHRTMAVGVTQRQVREDRENLKLAIRGKLFEIHLKVVNQQRRFQSASWKLKRARKTGEMSSLVKRYYADPAFKAHVIKLAEENNKCSLEDDSKILQNADIDIALGTSAAKRASKSKTFIIVTLPLGAYNTFLADYKTIMEEIFSNKVHPWEGKQAMRSWAGKTGAFTGKILTVRKEYRRMIYSGELKDAQVKSLRAELKRIDKVMMGYSKAINAEKKQRDAQARSIYETFRTPVEKLEKLFAKPYNTAELDQATLAWFHKSRKEMDRVSNNARVRPLKTGIKKDYARAKLRGLVTRMRISAEYKRQSSSAASGYVISCAANPSVGMSNMTKWLNNCVDTYQAGMHATQQTVSRLLQADEAIMHRRFAAVRNYEKLYEPYAAVMEYYGQYVRAARNDNRPGIVHWSSTWWAKHNTSLLTANRTTSRALHRLRLHHHTLANMYGFQKAMEKDFDREPSLLSRAQKLLNDARALAARYSGAKKDDPDRPENMVIAILRGGDRIAVFNQMIRRYNTVRRPLDGTFVKYTSVLRPQVKAAYRLNKPPFEGWRRTVKQNAAIIAGMAQAIDDAGAGKKSDARYANVRKQCKSIMTQLDNIGRQARLVGKQVSDIITQARKHTNAVYLAIESPKSFIRDIPSAKRTLSSFQAFAAQAAAHFTADNRTVRGYLQQAKALMASKASNQEARSRQLIRATELLNLAVEHAKVMKFYATYMGSWRFDGRIKALKQQLGKLGNGSGGVVNTGDPKTFRRAGIFSVSLNGKVLGQLPAGKIHELTADHGNLVIRSARYGPAFRNAKKVMLRLSAARGRRKKFVTVSEGKADFVYRTKIDYRKVYTLEMRAITRSNLGFEPTAFPARFRWNRRKTDIFQGVRVFRIRRDGQIIRMTAPLGRPMALRFTKGTLTSKAELNVVGTADKPFAGIAPNREVAKVNGRWKSLRYYARWAGRSRKFVHSSTEEDEQRRLRMWDFSAHIQPNEQYNVFLSTGNKWRLLAYVIGSSVGKPTPPATGGNGGDAKKVVTKLPFYDNFSKGFGNWDVSKIRPQPGKKALIWNAGKDCRRATLKMPIPMENVIIEFDGLCMSNGIGVRWFTDKNVGYSGTIGGWFNTKSCTDVGASGANRRIVGGKHLKLGKWQHHKWIRSGDWIAGWVDDKRIVFRKAPQRFAGTGKLDFTTWGAVIGIDNVRVSRIRTVKADTDDEHDDEHDDDAGRKKNHDSRKDDGRKTKTAGATAKAKYAAYIAAYNKLTSLMAAGKGDTPAAQTAYKAYKKAKADYEAWIKAHPQPKAVSD